MTSERRSSHLDGGTGAKRPAAPRDEIWRPGNQECEPLGSISNRLVWDCAEARGMARPGVARARWPEAV